MCSPVLQYLELLSASLCLNKPDGDGCRDPEPPSPLSDQECPVYFGFTSACSATDSSSSSDNDSSLCQPSNLRRPHSTGDVRSQAPLASQVIGNRRNRTSSMTRSVATRQSQPSQNLLSTTNDPADQLPNCHDHASVFQPTYSSQETRLTANDPHNSSQSWHSMTYHDTDETSSGSYSGASDTHDSSPCRMIHSDRCQGLTRGPVIHTTTIAESRSMDDRPCLTLRRPKFTTYVESGDMSSHAPQTSHIRVCTIYQAPSLKSCYRPTSLSN